MPNKKDSKRLSRIFKIDFSRYGHFVGGPTLGKRWYLFGRIWTPMVIYLWDEVPSGTKEDDDGYI